MVRHPARPLDLLNAIQYTVTDIVAVIFASPA